MLEMINFVFPISASMESSFMWGSESDSAADGCLENVTDLWMKMSNPPPWSWGRSVCTVV